MRHDLELTAGDIRLVPLAVEHAAALRALVDDEIWAGTVVPLPRTDADMGELVQTHLDAPDRYAFAVTDALTGEVRGQTTFYDVVLAQGRCEVGNTFYGRRWWGGSTNPAAKLAMLTHAFDRWGMHRVAFRADARNARSLAALARLGAVREGALRGHRLAADGTRQDSVYFSVLASEWPAVRSGLEGRLDALV